MRLAPCSKNIDHFFNEGAAPNSSGHETRFFLSAKDARSRWILKRYDDRAELAQIEAGMSALYYLLAKPGSIPKVYAVYRAGLGDAPSQLFAAVSAEFPDFQDLKTYLGTDFSEEKMQFLVDNGFPELCALSYFFEEDDFHKGNIGISDGKVVRVDFDMSAYSLVGKPELRGSRSSLMDSRDSHKLDEAFAITAADIDNFPELKDAKPYYFPTIYRVFASTNGYTSNEVYQFLSLKNNFRFINRVYATFLKIILTPDDAFKNILSAHIGDLFKATKFAEHFIQRKKSLREALLQKNTCRKFSAFFENMTRDVIRGIFLDMENHNLKNKIRFQQIDVSKSREWLARFVFDFSKTDIAEELFSFMERVERLSKKLTESQLAQWKALREKWLNDYERVLPAQMLSCGDMAQFLDWMKSNVKTVMGWLDSQSEGHETIALSLNKKMQHVQDIFQASQSLGEVDDDEVTEFDVVDEPMDFVVHAMLDEKKLARDVIEWITQTEKKDILEGVLRRFLKSAEEKESTVSAKLSSAFTSVASFSLFGRANNPSPSLIAQMQNTLASLSEPHAVFHPLFQILSFSGVSADGVKNQIVYGLMASYITVFLEKPRMVQMQIDPILSQYLAANTFPEYLSKAAMACIDAFKDVIRPYIMEFMEPVSLTAA